MVNSMNSWVYADNVVSFEFYYGELEDGRGKNKIVVCQEKNGSFLVWGTEFYYPRRLHTFHDVCKFLSGITGGNHYDITKT